jgi:hypothetical protein
MLKRKHLAPSYNVLGCKHEIHKEDFAGRTLITGGTSSFLQEQNEKISDIVEKDTFLCVSPTIEIVSEEDTLSKALQSHPWRVAKAESFGTDGFLTKIVCARCGLERTTVISDIEESAKKATRYRKRQKKK